MAQMCMLLASVLVLVLTRHGSANLNYFVPEQTISEDFTDFPLCVGVEVQGALNRPAGLDVRLLGLSNSLYTYNVGTDGIFEGVDDGYVFVGTLSNDYILYTNNYTDLYVGSNGQLSFGNGTDSFSGTFPLATPQAVLTPFWNDIDLTVGGTIYHRVINSGEELGDLSDRLRTIPRGECLQFEPSSAAVVTFERVSEFGGSEDIHNTFQVILLTNGTTSYTLFLYNSMAWGNGATIGFNNGTNFYTLGGENNYEKATVSGLPTSSNVGVDGVYIFQTQGGSIQTGLSDCAGNETTDFLPFISLQPFTNALMDFDGSSSELDNLVDKFVSSSMTLATFFQEFPIVDDFFFCVLIRDIDDQIIENTEELVFALRTGNESDTFGATNSNITFAAVPVFDNDGATLQFNHSDQTVMEADGNLVICIEVADLLEGLERDVVANITVISPTEDLDPLIAEVFFGQFSVMAGSVECVPIGIEDDDFVEDSETYTLALYPHNSNDMIDGSDTITVTIEDNDGAQVQFNHSDLMVLESDGYALICLELVNVLGGLERDVTVNLAVSTGTAGGADFTVNSTQVVFSRFSAMESAVECVNIAIEEDSIVEMLESFSVELTRLNTLDRIMGVASITVTIEDNDGATLQFNHTDLTVSESTTTAEICVELVNVLGGLERDVVSQLTVQFMTASAGDLNTTFTEVSFSNSSAENGSVQCVGIQINNDMIIEGSELFSVELDPTSYETDIIIGPRTIDVTIDDDDGADVRFNVTDFSVLEHDGSAVVCVALVNILDGLERDVVVRISQDALTTDALDFEVISTQVILTQNSLPECISINIVDDEFVEDSEIISVEIIPLNVNDMVTGPNTIDITIDDNDGLSYFIPAQTISEDFSSFPLCVNVDVKGGLQRSAGLDAKMLGFVNTLYTYNVGFDATFDGVDDGASFVGSLSSPYILYGMSYHDVYVSSNGQVAFGEITNISDTNREFPTSPPLVTAFWNDIDLRIGGVIYHRVINAGNELGDLRDRLKAVPGGECLDFEPTSAAVVTFEQVSPFSSTAEIHNTFQVILLTNGITSYTLFLYNSMAWGNGATIGFNNGTNFYTLDGREGIFERSQVLDLPTSSNVDTNGVFLFSTDSTAIQSGLQQCPSNIDTFFPLFVAPEPFTDVLDSINNSTTEFDDVIEDFIYRSMSTADFFLTLPIFDGFYFCVLVEDTDDDIIEDTEEFEFLFQSQNTNDVFEESDSNTAILTVPIFDNDGAAIQFNHSDLLVLESDGNVMVCAKLVNVSGGLERDVIVDMTVQSATADNSDFQASNDQLIFSQFFSMAQSVQCIDITIEDMLVENNEFFTVKMTPLNGNDWIIGADTVTVTIDNNDGVGLKFNHSNLTVSEDDEVVEICVQLVDVRGGLQRDVVVNITVQSMTAEGSDFDANSTEVVFGQTSSMNGSVECVDIVIDDTLIENSEVFTVELRPQNNDDRIIDENIITVTIEDNDGAEVQFNHSNITLSEVDTLVVICVKLVNVFGGLERDVVVNLNIPFGTAEDDTSADSIDYIRNSSQVVFRQSSAMAGSVECIIIASIQDDDFVEGNEEFIVELVPLNDKDQIIGPNTITVIIEDNEGASVRLSHNNQQVSESDGAVQICVELFNIMDGLERDVVVIINLQSATAGDSDFDASRHEVVFSQNSSMVGTEQCAEIAIEEDTIVEISETFSVALVPQNSDDGVVGVQTISVTINDNDGGTVSFNHGDIMVSEVLGFAQLCVRLDEVMGGLRRPLEFNINVLDFGAILPTADEGDVSTLTISSTFEPFSLRGVVSCHNISIVDDNFVEHNEVFTVELATVSSVDTVTGQEQLNITIMDDDGATLRLNESALTVEESVGFVYACVELVDISGGLQRDVVVGFTAEDITTNGGEDYDEFEPSQTTFSDSSQSGAVQCVRIGIEEDIAIEVQEQFRIVLAPANPNDNAGFPLVITIIDNEIDECASSGDRCEQMCTNTFPGIMCGCNMGYSLNGDGTTCDDVNECDLFTANNDDQCNTQRTLKECSNTVGSFDCVCPEMTLLGQDGFCLLNILELPQEAQENSVVLQLTGRTLENFTSTDVENIKAEISRQYCSTRPQDCSSANSVVKRQGTEVEVNVFVIGVNELGVLEVLVYVTRADGTVAPGDVVLNVVMEADFGIPVSAMSFNMDTLTAGEIAGIAVGAFFGVLILLLLMIALIVCCVSCRRRRQGGMKPASALEQAMDGNESNNDEFTLVRDINKSGGDLTAAAQKEEISETSAAKLGSEIKEPGDESTAVVRNEGFSETFAANLGSEVNESEENLTSAEHTDPEETKLDLGAAEDSDKATDTEKDDGTPA